MTVDLENQIVSDGQELISFKVDSFRRYCLLNGLDDIGLTLLNEEKVGEYEMRQKHFTF